MTRRTGKATLWAVALIAALRSDFRVEASIDDQHWPAPRAVSGVTNEDSADPIDVPMRVEATGANEGDDRRRPIVPGVVARPDVERTMRHDDPAIQQALRILDQAVNPVVVAGPDLIREIYARRPGAGAPRPGLIAFRAPGDANDPAIYVNRDSPLYQDAARKASALTLLKLAATLAHEQVHNTDGEFAAYRLQSDFIRSRLHGLSSHQREQGHWYLQALDARANVLALFAHRAAANARAAPPP